jgi:hypothetical protein
MTATTFTSSLQTLLDSVFDPLSIAPSHITLVLQGIATNERGLTLFNNWIQANNNLAQLQSAIGTNALANMLRPVLSFNANSGDIAALRAFFQGQALPQAVTTAVNDGLTQAGRNVDWLNVNLGPITAYLQSL